MKKLICLVLLLATFCWFIPAQAAESTATRTVIVTFDKPDDGPALTGGIIVAYAYGKNPQSQPVLKTVPVQNNKCVFEVPINSYLYIASGKLVGYYFDAVKGKPVPAGSKPLELELDLKIAGIITGKAYDSNNQPVNTPLAQVIIFTDNRFIQDYFVPIINGEFSISTVPQDRGGMLFFGPIPIPTGDFTDYRVVLNNNGNLIISDPVRLNKKNPVSHVELKFKKGQRVYGVLRNERKEPVSGEQLWLRFQVGNIWMLAKKLTCLKTKEDGSFEIPAVNFDAASLFSGYKLILPESKKYEGKTIDLDNDTDMPLNIIAEDQ